MASCGIRRVTVQYRGMLSLLLPPIIIFVALTVLVWIFWRKKPEADRLFWEKVVRLRDAAKRSVSRPGLAESVSARIARKRQGIANMFQKKGAGLDGVKTETSVRIPPDSELRSQREKMLSFGRQFLNKDAPVTQEEEKPKEVARVVPPVAKEKVVLPAKAVSPEKSQFEDILVERIAMNPRDIEAYERLGDYYMDRDSYDDAKECYKQVLRLSPVNRKAKLRMRKLEKILGSRIRA